MIVDYPGYIRAHYPNGPRSAWRAKIEDGNAVIAHWDEAAMGGPAPTAEEVEAWTAPAPSAVQPVGRSLKLRQTQRTEWLETGEESVRAQVMLARVAYHVAGGMTQLEATEAAKADGRAFYREFIGDVNLYCQSGDTRLWERLDAGEGPDWLDDTAPAGGTFRGMFADALAALG